LERRRKSLHGIAKGIKGATKGRRGEGMVLNVRQGEKNVNRGGNGRSRDKAIYNAARKSGGRRLKLKGKIRP